MCYCTGKDALRHILGLLATGALVCIVLGSILFGTQGGCLPNNQRVASCGDKFHFGRVVDYINSSIMLTYPPTGYCNVSISSTYYTETWWVEKYPPNSTFLLRTTDDPNICVPANSVEAIYWQNVGLIIGGFCCLVLFVALAILYFLCL